MNILITAGPTREYFDSVRFISNSSSGKMGYALAAAAARRGHRVTLISGPVSLTPPVWVQTIRVVSAAEMAAAAKAFWPDQDAALMTAAVCDYRPARRVNRKLKKSDRLLRIILEPTEDIARSFGAAKQPGQILIAFAMEDRDARRRAEAKSRRKNCDAIVLNGPANIGADLATVEVLVAGGKWTRWRPASKARIADRLVRLAETLHRRARNGRGRSRRARHK